jgi:hypothetical protein
VQGRSVLLQTMLANDLIDEFRLLMYSPSGGKAMRGTSMALAVQKSIF